MRKLTLRCAAFVCARCVYVICRGCCQRMPRREWHLNLCGHLRPQQVWRGEELSFYLKLNIQIFHVDCRLPRLLQIGKINYYAQIKYTRICSIYTQAYMVCYKYIYIYILMPLHPCEILRCCIELAPQSGNFIIFHFDKQTQWRPKRMQEDAVRRRRAEAQKSSSAAPGRDFVMHELIGLPTLPSSSPRVTIECHSN